LASNADGFLVKVRKRGGRRGKRGRRVRSEEEGGGRGKIGEGNEGGKRNRKKKESEVIFFQTTRVPWHVLRTPVYRRQDTGLRQREAHSLQSSEVALCLE
jgi:hypothetical protein